MISIVLSKFRVFRLRLRYAYYKAKYKYNFLDFMWDNSDEFQSLLKNLKQKKYQQAVILGNASNLSSLDFNTYRAYRKKNNTLTIGLNNSYLLFQSDLVLWGEEFVLHKLLQQKSEVPYTIFIFASQLLDDRRRGLKFWKEHQKFKGYPLETLFKARTILVSALYLSYILDIKKIYLYGVSMDDYSHFYIQEGEESRKTFEFLSEKRIEQEYYGYTVHKIVKEVIDYLISEGFTIYYSGESKFLDSISGIKRCSG